MRLVATVLVATIFLCVARALAAPMFMPLGDLSAHRRLDSLGPEPLGDDFTPERLGEMLQGRRKAIKKCLLDQRFIAGIGNVYVQDILWYARLHPLRPASSLDAADVERLCGAIRRVLEEGIRWGGGYPVHCVGGPHA